MLGFLSLATLGPKVLKLVKKGPLWCWLLVVIGVGYQYYNGQLDDARASVAQTLLAGDSTVQLLDGEWSARLAQKERALVTATELADELQSQLIASATIEITPEPVVVDTVTLVTEVLSDSTRTATLSDTSAVAVLDLSVVAPPCCDDLKVSFTLTPQPIKFDVALVQMTDNQAVFAVSYFGGVTEISASYARLPEKPDRFKPFVGANYDFLDTGWSLQGGVELDLVFGVKLDAFLQQALTQQDGQRSLRLLMQGRKYF